jgi:hypothetical protein
VVKGICLYEMLVQVIRSIFLNLTDGSKWHTQ